MSNLKLSVAEGVSTLTILRDLLSICRDIENHENVHAVVLIGEGSAFCAGGDIDSWSKLDAQEFGRQWIREGHQALDALARLRQPLIAALNGHVLGGGFELAACADYRIAEAHIRIGQPETALGIIPGWSGTQRAVRRFGPKLVRRMAIFGEKFTAEEALRLGLVDTVVPQGEGLAAATALAKKMKNRGTIATELTKMLINAAEGEERERVHEAMAGRLAALHPELKTGLKAFENKEMADYWTEPTGET